MTIKQALAEAQQKLNKGGIKTARLDAELILGHVLNKSREYLLTYPENKVSKGQVTNMNHDIMRRLNWDPIAYITGNKSFYGLNFAVTEDVLVPRPETEMMIDEAIQLTRTIRYATVIDVGTGSGCIITTLAKNLKSIFKYFAIDISGEALKVAKTNAEKNNVGHKIEFFKGDILEPLISDNRIEADSELLIAANLPYLTPFQVDTSPTIQNEPILALEAGDDGLKYYRQLFKQVNKLKKEINIFGHILCEIDSSQNESITKLASDLLHVTVTDIEIKKDLAGLDRLVIIKF